MLFPVVCERQMGWQKAGSVVRDTEDNLKFGVQCHPNPLGTCSCPVLTMLAGKHPDFSLLIFF